MPKTITLCSSMQFKTEIILVKKQLEALGHTVLTPELSEKSEEYVLLSPDEQKNAKRAFIQNHFNRIAAADAILVLNYKKKGVDGYIGSNTLMEIGVACYLGKEIYLIQTPGEQGCREEVLAVMTGVFSL